MGVFKVIDLVKTTFVSIAILSQVGCDRSFKTSLASSAAQELPGSSTGAPGSSIIDPATGETLACDPGVAPQSAPTARRLTRFQYFTILNSIFGISTDDLVPLFPADIRFDGFSNQEVSLGVSRGHVTAFRDIAEAVVARKQGDFSIWRKAKFTACTTMSAACFDEYVSKLGLHLFRRPVSPEELALFRLVYTQYSLESAPLDETLQAVTVAMLQAPQFLYRLESIGETESQKAVDPYTLASRLSFLVWQTGPDHILLDLAASGEILYETVIRAQVRRMLDQAPARSSLKFYVHDWLGLERLGGIDIDLSKYPALNVDLIEDMKLQTSLYFENLVFTEKKSLLESLTEKTTFLNNRLGQLYGINLPSEQFVKVDVSALPGRVGFLSQPAVLMAPLRSDHPSIVQRGIYMMEDVFCQEIPSAPPGVANDLILPEAGTSQRDRLEAHRSEKACASCHAVLDGPGLAFDNFNTIGSFRTNDEHGNSLFSFGNWFLDGERVQWNDNTEFLSFAKGSTAVRTCFVKKALQFSLGRSLRDADRCAGNELAPKIESGNYTYQTLIEEIAAAKVFRVITNEGE